MQMPWTKSEASLIFWIGLLPVCFLVAAAPIFRGMPISSGAGEYLFRIKQETVSVPAWVWWIVYVHLRAVWVGCFISFVSVVLALVTRNKPWYKQRPDYAWLIRPALRITFALALLTFVVGIVVLMRYPGWPFR